MNDDSRRAEFRITGSIAFSSTPPAPEPPPAPAFAIAGSLVSARGGYPLPGLAVTAYLVAPPDAAASFAGDGARLGSAAADQDGRFTITFDDAPRMRQRLWALGQAADASVALAVDSAGGQRLYTSEPFPITGRPIAVTLAVPLPEMGAPGEMWVALGAQLEAAGIAQVNLLARQLAAPDGQSLFADWDLETRQATLIQLEEDFLDPQRILREVAAPLPTLSELRAPGALEAFQERLQPHLERPDVQAAFADFAGKAQSFPDLFSVDWTMDLNDFRQGNLRLALNKFIDNYRAGVGRAVDIFFRVENDLTRYRDYLREIWPTWIMRVIYVQPQGWTKQKALEQLRNRFHQDFFTSDTTAQPANNVLIPILTDILTAPAGTAWGFGIAPATIQPQGTRSPRQYLDYLIGLSGLSARELGLRYRLDFARPDSALSSPVQENIATLQGFYRDSFQCDAEPVHVEPDVLDQPIVPGKLQGKAPFFLHFDEWLRQQSLFYAENVFDIRRTLRVDVRADLVKRYRDWLNGAIQSGYPVETRPEWQFIASVWDISDRLGEADTQYYRGEYADALNKYHAAYQMAYAAIQNRIVANFDIAGALAARKKLSVKDMQELALFMKPSAFGLSFEYNLREYDRDDMVLALIYYCLYTIPVCLGDTYLALGDYANSVFYYGQATRFHVAVARETDGGGYRPEWGDFNPSFSLYSIGDQPYTVNLHVEPFDQYPYVGGPDGTYDTGIIDSPVYRMARELINKYAHRVEAKYFRLRQANAMLEWADVLYRTNDATNIQRARELYKGVSFLHRETPPICPDWPQDWRFGGLGELPLANPFKNQRENPALVSQKVRARKGVFQIQAGLNYYGERNDVVPPLRYRPLQDTADRFAALAKAAQQDFLLYMEKMESALIERMKLSNLLQKASLQANIAGEQIKVAQYNVTVAQEQVANVQAQIAAKEKEIADADSFFSQLGDFFGGMAKTFTALPGDTQSAVKAGFVSELTGKELVGQGMLGLGAGASIMAGFGIFAVAGYMSMSSMADAANSRAGQLRALREQALPLAEGLVEAKQREVQIARYQQQIAQADMELARDLIQFEENRFLNLNFWSNMAHIARRILRRYLELGTRMAWLAERALAYEQDRPLTIIRLDYFPEKMQGVTGADLLQADLAELEATRVEGIKRSVPVTYTFSLARDFPLQFGQLKRTGRCTFKTEELPFALAYPGTTGYRVRAVSLFVSQVSLTSPVRGLLINQGISISHPGLPDEHVIVRPAEALPISEFKLQNDMAIYSLPDETLLAFEGSAVETFWEIILPAAANPAGYDGIADVLLTLDLWAQYSPDLYARQLADAPNWVRRWIVVSGKQYQPDAIIDLAGAANVATIDFDMGALKLPAREANRKLKNVAVCFVSPAPLAATAQFSATQPAMDVAVAFKNGVAMSNIPPTVNDLVPLPLPLNVLADVAADQRFRLTIDKTQNPGIDFSGVTDVVLAVEYAADVL